MGWRAWKNDEDKYIVEHPDMFPEDLAEHLNRSINAVKSRLQLLGIKQGRRKAGWQYKDVDVGEGMDIVVTYKVDGRDHTASLKSCVLRGIRKNNRRIIDVSLITKISVKKYGKKKENKEDD